MPAISKPMSLFDGLDSAIADKSIVGTMWFSSQKAANEALLMLLVMLHTNDDREPINDLINSGRLILFIHSACCSKANNAYSKGAAPGTASEVLTGWNFKSTVVVDKAASKGTIWGALAIVLLSYARSNNWAGTVRRIETAFKIAGVLVPQSINGLFNVISMNDSAVVNVSERFNAALWSLPDFAKDHIKEILLYEPTDSIGTAVMSQIKMVYEYAGMTFIPNIRTFMTSSQTAVRVLKPVVDEYRKLLNALDTMQKQHPDIPIGHYKLLRIPGSEILDSSKYPILTSVVQVAMESQTSVSGVRYVTKVSSPMMTIIRNAFGQPIPAKYLGTSGAGLTDEDLALIGLSRTD